MGKYKVYMDKAYLAEKPKGFYRDFMPATIVAQSRTEAAQIYWEQSSAIIIPLLASTVKRVSVYVSADGAISARSKNRNLAGRLDPITVMIRG